MNTLSHTKQPNFRFLAYKLGYLMTVIEIFCHPLTYLPECQYRLQVLLGFVERSFKHHMPNFVTHHCRCISNLIYGIITPSTTYYIYQPEKSVTSIGKKQYHNSKNHDFVYQSTAKTITTHFSTVHFLESQPCCN